MVEALKKFDMADVLETDEDCEVFLADAFETRNVAYIAKAIGVIARAKGMSKIAEETGLAREQLYKSFSQDGNPTLASTLAVMDAIGFDLTGKPHRPH